jgi:hypothetical protein
MVWLHFRFCKETYLLQNLLDSSVEFLTIRLAGLLFRRRHGGKKKLWCVRRWKVEFGEVVVLGVSTRIQTVPGIGRKNHLSKKALEHDARRDT